MAKLQPLTGGQLKNTGPLDKLAEAKRILGRAVPPRPVAPLKKKRRGGSAIGNKNPVDYY
jgi:hypothetical protein